MVINLYVLFYGPPNEQACSDEEGAHGGDGTYRSEHLRSFVGRKVVVRVRWRRCFQRHAADALTQDVLSVKFVGDSGPGPRVLQAWVMGKVLTSVSVRDEGFQVNEL